MGLIDNLNPAIAEVEVSPTLSLNISTLLETVRWIVRRASVWYKDPFERDRPMEQTGSEPSGRHPRKCRAHSKRSKQLCERWAMKAQTVCAMQRGQGSPSTRPI